MNPFGQENENEHNLEIKNTAKYHILDMKNEFKYISIYIGGQNSCPLWLYQSYACKTVHNQKWLTFKDHEGKISVKSFYRIENNMLYSHGYRQHNYIIKDVEETYNLSFITIMEFTPDSIILATAHGYVKCIDKINLTQGKINMFNIKFEHGITSICTTISPDFWIILASIDIFIYFRQTGLIFKINAFYGLILGFWKTNLGHIFITNLGGIYKLAIKNDQFKCTLLAVLATTVLQADVMDVALLQGVELGTLITITCCNYIAMFIITMQKLEVEIKLLKTFEIQDNLSGIRMISNEKSLFLSPINNEHHIDYQERASILAMDWNSILVESSFDINKTRRLILIEKEIKRLEICRKMLITLQNNHILIHNAYSLECIYLIKINGFVENVQFYDHMIYFIYEDLSLFVMKRLPSNKDVSHICCKEFETDICNFEPKYKFYVCHHYFE